MDFKPLIAPELTLMDARIFDARTPMGIKSDVVSRNGRPDAEPATFTAAKL